MADTDEDGETLGVWEASADGELIPVLDTVAVPVLEAHDADAETLGVLEPLVVGDTL